MKSKDDVLIGTVSQLQNLNITMLKPSEFNEFEIDGLDDLKESIMTFGLLTPLTVIGPFEDGKYSTLAGERRYTVIQDLVGEGYKYLVDVPCLIVGDKDMNVTLQKLIIETSNLETRNFNKTPHYFKVVELLFELYKGKDVKRSKIVKETANRLKSSKRYGRMIVQIFEKGEESLFEMAKEGKIPIDKASRLASLPKEDQAEAVQEIKNGEHTKDVIEKHTNKFKGKNSFDLDKINEEIDSLSDDDDLEVIDVENVSASVGPTETFTSLEIYTDDENEAYKSKLRMVIDWCNEIKKKENPSVEELDAIEACREVAERFS